MNFLVVCLLLAISVGLAFSLSVPKFISNNMVWQRNKQNCLVGNATVGNTVNVGLVTTSASVAASFRVWNYSTVAPSTGSWSICVPTTVYSRYGYAPFNIYISDSSRTITVTNAIYGEVFLCSGQSNMRSVEVRDLFDYSTYQNENRSTFNMRLYFVTTTRSTATPQEDTPGPVTWTDVAKDTTNAYAPFSAMCYVFGREVMQQIGVPVGLIESAVSGTSIEAWMDTPAFLSCNYTDPQAGTVPLQAGLYNGMIHPFRNFSIAGFLWYQGESNSGMPTQYKCAQNAMLRDWRAK